MRWGDYSGLCSWALNIIINFFIKGRIQRLDYRTGEYYVITQEEIAVMCFEDGVGAKCKEYRWTLKSEKREENRLSPHYLQK